MRVCMIEAPADLLPNTPIWTELANRIKRDAPDLLVTNEMPFGPWLAASASYDSTQAEQSVQLHERGLEALAELNVPAVISSRPVPNGDRLANEAFALEGDRYTRLHHKQYFPQEEGFYEALWFRPSHASFDVHVVGGVPVGVLLCTELMFNERARAYGRAGAELIAVPRATGMSVSHWQTAGSMAALVSGCYVVSSNRVGQTANGQTFGGAAFAYLPGGERLATSNRDYPVMVVDIEPAKARAQQKLYPCYVPG